MERIFNNVKITSSFEMPETRENLVSGETIGQHFGKIAKVIDDLENGEFSSKTTIDTELSDTSTNPVQNKVIKSYVDNSLANIQTALNSKANSEDVYTKSETDAKIIEKVAEIVAGAPADFDTLKEMSEWIKNHEGSAAEMNAVINANSTNIASIQAEIGDIETVLSSIVEVNE